MPQRLQFVFHRPEQITNLHIGISSPDSGSEPTQVLGPPPTASYVALSDRVLVRSTGLIVKSKLDASQRADRWQLSTMPLKLIADQAMEFVVFPTGRTLSSE